MKATIKSFLLIITAFLIFSCSNISDSSSKSSLLIYLPGNSVAKSVGHTENNVNFYKISLKYNAGEYTNPSVHEAGSVILLKDLASGQYGIKGEAYARDNGKEVLLAVAETTAVVESGKETSAILNFKWVSSEDEGSNTQKPDVTPTEPETPEETEEKPSGDMAMFSVKLNTSGADRYSVVTGGWIDETVAFVSLDKNSEINLNGKNITIIGKAGTLVSNSKDIVVRVKNGTIDAGSLTHNKPLFDFTAGTLVLENVTIEGFKSVSEFASVVSAVNAKVYFENVNIGSCYAPAAKGTIFVKNGEFYALNSYILECAAKVSCGVYLEHSKFGFVGGGILMSDFPSGIASKPSSEASALYICDGSEKAADQEGEVYVSATTIFANPANYAVPVVITDGGHLNMADGIKFKKFDSVSMSMQYVKNSAGSEYVTASVIDPVTFSSESNSANPLTLIAAYNNGDVYNLYNNVAVKVGTSGAEDDEKGRGYLFMNGNSQVYGKISVQLYSAIAQTGALSVKGENSSDGLAAKIYFEDIEKYSEVFADNMPVYGNFPLYWMNNSFEIRFFGIANDGYTFNSRSNTNGVTLFYPKKK